MDSIDHERLDIREIRGHLHNSISLDASCRTQNCHCQLVAHEYIYIYRDIYIFLIFSHSATWKFSYGLVRRSSPSELKSQSDSKQHFYCSPRSPVVARVGGSQRRSMCSSGLVWYGFPLVIPSILDQSHLFPIFSIFALFYKYIVFERHRTFWLRDAVACVNIINSRIYIILSYLLLNILRCYTELITCCVSFSWMKIWQLYRIDVLRSDRLLNFMAYLHISLPQVLPVEFSY